MSVVGDWVWWLGELVKSHKDDIEILAAVAGVVGVLVPALMWLARRVTKPRLPDPRLSDPPRGDGGIARFSTRAVELLGRDREMERLRAFLASEGGFLWMQIAGAGGQGKSRLAYELTLEVRDEDWCAGLLEAGELKAFAQRWASWTPRQRHLIVLDYVVGREEDIKPVIQTLSARAPQFKQAVRLLLLERQRWDRGGLGAARSSSDRVAPGTGSVGRAEWFLRLAERFDGNDPQLEASRFEDGVLELERLAEKDLVDIVRRVSKRAGAESVISDEIIAKQLMHIDKAGRPLYAYFLGQALAAGAQAEGPSGRGWQRDDLLTATIDRDRGSRWMQTLGGEVPSLGDNSPAERIAVIATIAGGLDCAEAARKRLIPHPDANTRRQALVLTDGPLGGGASGPSQRIPALQPDLLGEWLVLSSVVQGLPGGELLDLAYRHAPDQAAAFLQRLSQDFPDHAVTEELLEREPPDGPSREALVKVAAAILVNLHRARRDFFPKQVVEALIAAANAGDARAMNGLGYSYWAGEGVERDVSKAAEWFRRSANAGHLPALSNVGHCYRDGEGVERDPAKAVEWFRKGAEAGDGLGMNNLGFCYQEGFGVERDLEEAAHWYRRGAEAGDEGAMTRLGLCHENAQGVDRDARQAVYWYRKAAEAGDAAAMCCLGGCYQRGVGVEANLARALDWYRKGADAGDSRAMVNLGACYQKGEGVAEDLSQALHWYRRAAEIGDSTAMVNLGFCYYSGRGVARDESAAVTWFLKGAEAGDGRAMAHLGVSYFLGRGVERDVARAVDWYRKGAEKGDIAATTRLRAFNAGEALVAQSSKPDEAAENWARRKADTLGSAPWVAPPPVRGQWEELSGPSALIVLAALKASFEAAGLSDELESLMFQRMRRTSLPFYKGCDLVDLQLERGGQRSVLCASALVTPTAAALLDGTSPMIHVVNLHLLTLPDDEATSAYLRFFSFFVRGDDGPFQIVDEMSDLPPDVVRLAESSERLREAVTPLQTLDGDLSIEGWRRFAASVLYSDALFRATFKVLADGMLEMTGDDKIASDLPVPARRYDGIFRSP